MGVVYEHELPVARILQTAQLTVEGTNPTPYTQAIRSSSLFGILENDET
jgi:hypothetical protein